MGVVSMQLFKARGSAAVPENRPEVAPLPV